LLDEATSNLDLRTESAVNTAMGVAAHGRTTILIAHRLRRLASRSHVVIDDGAVVEDGRTKSSWLGAALRPGSGPRATSKATAA